MAILKSVAGHEIELSADHLVGRSTQADTHLPNPQVSGRHAAIRWSESGWQVRDLGSRNGTWLDGQRLSDHDAAPISTGSVVWFGGAEHAYTMVDASPPDPRATSERGVARGDARLLAIPSEDDPVAVVSFEEAGWTLSTDDEVRVVSDGERVELDGVSWVLSLPQAVTRTIDATPLPIVSSARGLTFQVSADEEYVEVAVDGPAGSHGLPPRAHQYTLLVLARARLQDAEHGVSEAEQGWVYTADLARQLRMTMNRLYVTLHRCRKELDAVEDGAGMEVIEKRVTTRQVRVGWSRLAVTSL